MSPDPPRVVHASAPIRICDNGGWTDTWFAGRGAVCSLAIEPAVHAEVLATARSVGAPSLGIDAAGGVDLVTAAVDESGARSAWDLAIVIRSQAPAGASTGTSAALCVAVLAALDALSPGRGAPQQLAEAAHRVETERLGRQCGIQDQLAAAYGGINFIEMATYPHGVVTPIRMSDHDLAQLERRLVLVYLGRGHDSSAVHDEVITSLEAEAGPPPQLAPLRAAAEAARDALQAGDLDAYGSALIDNTEAQAALHPSLVGTGARVVIDAVRAAGAIGWKVNGAGGDGGSLAVLTGTTEPSRRAVIDAIERIGGGVRIVPIKLRADGVRVWGSPPPRL